jgi:hypothetical protein
LAAHMDISVRKEWGLQIEDWILTLGSAGMTSHRDKRLEEAGNQPVERPWLQPCDIFNIGTY